MILSVFFLSIELLPYLLTLMTNKLPFNSTSRWWKNRVLYLPIFAVIMIGFWFAGVPWTHEEHQQFLLGLQRFGKGEWRHISRNFVPSKTPTQVASHAQKFFNRHCNSATRGKRRSSLFDMVLDTVCLDPISLMNIVLYIQGISYWRENPICK